MRSVAVLNGDPVAESSGCWIVVGADAVIHRLRYPEVHLTELGLNPDLFKNNNPEALVAGIRFVIRQLDVSKINALSVVLSAGALRVRATGPARASRAAAGARSARM